MSKQDTAEWNAFKQYKLDHTGPETKVILSSGDINSRIEYLKSRETKLKSDCTANRNIRDQQQKIYDEALKDLQHTNHRIQDTIDTLALIDRELADLDGRKKEIKRATSVRKPKAAKPPTVKEALNLLKGLSKEKLLSLLAEQ